MNWLSCNMRGLNNPFKQKELRFYLTNNKIVLAGILETKVKEHKFKGSCDRIARDCNCANNYTEAGRIWLLWKENAITLNLLETHS